MSSNILTIYDQIAATSITVNGTAVTVKDADQLPNRVASFTVTAVPLTVMLVAAIWS